jgi:hypothetical protein
VNAITRGDLRARLGTHRGIWVQTIYLGICSTFLLLSLPPEIGRFELREANLLLAFLVVQLVSVTYLTSAFAVAELSLEGEKGLPDLALSAFSPHAVAVGKLATSGVYAVYLVAVGFPIVTLAAALRGAALEMVAAAAVLIVAVATAVGTWGTWLGGRLTSDFTRSFVHWAMLGSIFVGTTLLPSPWTLLNPVRLLDHTIREGWTTAFAVVAAAYLVAAGGGALLIRSYIASARLTGAEV